MAALSVKENRANRRRARSFESLVQAGLSVIAARGLYETTIEHITEAADVGKGTFYVHFPSKEDLVVHLVRLGFGELIAAGRAKVSSGSAATDRLAALIRNQLRFLDRRRDLVILLHQARSLLILRPEARQRLRREYRRYIQFLAEECRRALGKPRLSATEAQALACGVAGFIAGTLSFWMVVRGGQDTPVVPNGPISAFAAGLAARYGPSGPSANERCPRPGDSGSRGRGDEKRG